MGILLKGQQAFFGPKLAFSLCARAKPGIRKKYCNHPKRRSKMKNVLTSILVVMLLVGLIGCGDKGDKQSNVDRKDAVEAPKARPDQHPEQPGSMGKSTKGSW